MVRAHRPVRSAAVALVGAVVLAGAVAPAAARAEDAPPVPAEAFATDPAPAAPEGTEDGTETVSAVVETADGPEVVSVEAAPSEVDEAIAELAELPGVVSVGVDGYAYTTAAPDDPERPYQWGFDDLSLDLLPEGTPDASEVLVAVLDTGVLATHEDLIGRVRCDLGASFTEDEAIEDPDDKGCVDPNGHGTHVAGTVAAIRDNGVGVAGVSSAQIIPVRVLGADGYGTFSMVAAGIRYAVDQGASVINMSLGGPLATGGHPFYSEAVQYALDHDVVVVASSGNSREEGNRPGFPAAVPGVIAVAATSWAGNSASFSTAGPYVAISAPGHEIMSTTIGEFRYGVKSGTSMAAPHVAGVVARYRAAHPTATAAQVRAAVRDTAVDLEAPGFDHATGHGLIDAYELLTGEEAPGTPSSTPPGAPVVESLWPGDGTVTVRWAPSAFDGGSPIQTYFVEAWDRDAGYASAVVDADVHEAQLTGLVNGVEYFVTVSASTSGFDGGMAEGGYVTPSAGASVPPVPTAPELTGMAGDDGTATVSWTPGAGTDVAALTGWTVRAYQGATLVETIRVPREDLIASVTGLVNGTAYSLTVQGRNISGAGAESTPAGPVTPRTAPGTVTAPTVTPGPAKVTVQWSAPAVNGGSPITGYTVLTHREGVEVRSDEVGGTATSLVVDGLTSGLPHTFTVAARNAAGSFPGYRHSAAVVPAAAVAVPGAPVIGAPTPAAGSATARWTAPASDGGSPVTGYTVRAWRGTTLVKAVTTSAAARSAVVSGLLNGTAYTFTVTAANAVGAGPASARSVAATPRTRPGAPKIGIPTAGKGSARITWTAPAATGGAPITGYVVKVWRGTTLVKAVPVAASARAAVVYRLRPGVAYSLTVTAKNVAGLGTPSARSRSVVPRR